jgi:hypothetical protein
LSFSFSCQVFLTIPPSGICFSFGAAYQAGIDSIVRYGNISPHHIQGTATSLFPFAGTSPYHASLCTRGSLSYSYGRKCDSACRESLDVGRGNPGNHSKIAQVFFSAVRTAFCSDNSCRLAGSQRSMSSQTPSSSTRSSWPGS